jgi:hypothetical protein
MKGKEYNIAVLVVCALIVGAVFHSIYKWWEGPRRVEQTTTNLKRLSDGFAKNDTGMIALFNSNEFKDGWGKGYAKEDADGGIRFRSAGPDQQFNTDDDILSEIRPVWVQPPEPEKKGIVDRVKSLFD